MLGISDFDTFLHKVKSGWIPISVPDGETIYAFPPSNFVTNKFYQRRTGEEGSLFKKTQWLSAAIRLNKLNRVDAAQVNDTRDDDSSNPL